jgi:deazaflavin-dependent oxidoreductase (nitroreductase family)
MNLEKLYNPLVIWLVRSPLHAILDRNTMVIVVTGRKSGKRYTIPVSYVRDGESLLVISQKNRRWWKNLRNGAPVTVILQGHALQGQGEVFTDVDMSANILLTILRQVPFYQRMLHLPLDANGQPENPEAFRSAAEDHVIVRVQELAELAA